MSDDLSGFSLMELFRSEADGQIAALTEGLLALEGQASPSPSTLEPLMRAAHSLKGAARIVGLDAAVRVAHALEDDFVAAQRGEFVIESHHVDILLKSVDLLGQIAMLAEEQAAPWQADNERVIAAAVASLERLRTSEPPEATPGPSPSPLPPGRGAGGGGRRTASRAQRSRPRRPPGGP